MILNFDRTRNPYQYSAESWLENTALKRPRKSRKPISYFKVRPCSECKLTPLMKMELTEYSETSEYKIQTPGNHPQKENKQEPLCLRSQVHDTPCVFSKQATNVMIIISNNCRKTILISFNNIYAKSYFR
jgi:hypothetical protein